MKLTYRAVGLAVCLCLTGCYASGGVRNPAPARVANPVYPAPESTPYGPQIDACNARFYLGLEGQSVGGISFASLPQPYRVLAPAKSLSMGQPVVPDIQPLVDVTPGQGGNPYAIPNPAGQVDARFGPQIPDRLTLELDEFDYVSRVYCG